MYALLASRLIYVCGKHVDADMGVGGGEGKGIGKQKGEDEATMMSQGLRATYLGMSLCWLLMIGLAERQKRPTGCCSGLSVRTLYKDKTWFLYQTLRST